jgi:AraC family transcriptional regulator
MFGANGGTGMGWQDRIDRVNATIRTDLTGDLSLDRLADVAALSRFHFHRVYVAMQGETVAEAVRRARLNHAAALVVGTTMPLGRIGAVCGYPDPDSLSRAFRSAFGATPSALRRGGVLPQPLLPKDQGNFPMHPVTIETWPDRVAACLPHTGPYTAIGATFGRLNADIRQGRLAADPAAGFIGIYHDDPQSVPASALRAHAGVFVVPGTHLPDKFDRLQVPGGRHAVLTLKGGFEGIAAAWSWLYGVWLPQSGEEPGDRAPFEIYPDDVTTTPPAEVRTLICVPLRDTPSRA